MNLNVIAVLFAIVIFIFLLFWGEWNARRQKRVLGRFHYGDCIATTRILGRFSGRIVLLNRLKWLSIMAGLLILLYQWRRQSNFLVLLVALWLLVTGVAQWARGRIPASILVLGSSSEEQISLQSAIRDAAVGYAQ